MYYVIESNGKIIFHDSETIQIEPESALYIPRGLKY
jgi:hypothetical protein